MARHHKADKSHTQDSAGAVPTPGDEQAAALAAALAKLKDPPPPQALVGSVVQAGGSVQPSAGAHHGSTPASAPAQRSGSPTPTHQTHQTPPEHPHPEHVPVLEKAAAVTEALKTQLSQDGPLDPKDLLKLAAVLKQKQPPAPPEPAIKTETIVPTAPEPDATIAFQIAEKKRIAEAEAAAAEAEKWHVEQAKIHERKLDKPKMYKLAAYWLAAIPVAFILYWLARLIGGNHLRGIIGLVVMLPIYLLGIYGLVGWIPLMLEYLKTQKR